MGKMSLSVLGEAEVQLIHERTLDVFEQVGVQVGHDETLARLAKAGARVNGAGGLVKLPRQLVMDLLALAPAYAVETGLNGKVMQVGGDNRYYLSLILDPTIVDYAEGKRPPRLDDVRRHTIIGQSLERVSTMMRMEYPVSDVPGPNSYYRTMEMFLSHTTKHTSAYPTSAENCRDWIEVFDVIADAAGLDARTSPLLSVAIAVRSPLSIDGINIEIMKMAMSRCYPVISTVCPMAGATSPYTTAGTILQANVEALLAVLMVQLYKPGHPVFHGNGPSVADMRSGRDLYYPADKMLFKLAATQMGKFYRLPIAGEAGGTLTCRPDVQNGAESLAYLLASHAGGQNLIGGLGSLGNALGMSAEQIIMQAGLVDMAEFLARGVCVDEAHLALDSIARVGPGGSFFDDDLTLSQLRAAEFFSSPHFDMSCGHEAGALGMYEKAHETAEKLVSDYRPQVPGKVIEALGRYFHRKCQPVGVNAYA